MPKLIGGAHPTIARRNSNTKVTTKKNEKKHKE